MSDKAPVFDREAALNLLDGDEELLSILIDSFLTENKFEKRYKTSYQCYWLLWAVDYLGLSAKEDK